jgi:hypothetical protein
MLCDSDIAHYSAAGSAQHRAFQKTMDVHKHKLVTTYMALLHHLGINPCANTREDARQEGLQGGGGAGGSDGDPGAGGGDGTGAGSGGGDEGFPEEEYEIQEDNEESALEPEPDPTNSANQHQVLLDNALHGALACMNIGSSSSHAGSHRGTSWLMWWLSYTSLQCCHGCWRLAHTCLLPGCFGSTCWSNSSRISCYGLHY